MVARGHSINRGAEIQTPPCLARKPSTLSQRSPPTSLVLTAPWISAGRHVLSAVSHPKLLGSLSSAHVARPLTGVPQPKAWVGQEH